MNRKKIIFFIGFYPQIVGGAEYQCRLIADNLKNEYQIIFISYGHNNNLTEYIDGYKVYKISLKNYFFHRLTFYYFISIKIKKIIKVENPELIYQRILNSFSYYLSNISLKRKIPFVLHVADNKCLLFKDHKFSTKARKIFFKSINNSSPNYICQSEDQFNLLSKYGTFNSIIVPNLHKQLYFNYPKIKTRNIVWIANVREFKQLDIFIKLSKLMAEYNTFVFNVVGNINSDKYGKKLLNSMNESPIVYHGKKSNEWINRFLYESLVLINTSLPNSEGLPNTFIQSWLAGTPVISLNEDPNGYITRNKLGYCCNGNFECLIKSIIHIDQMPLEEYIQLSNNCINFAVNEFDVDTNINKINNLFKSFFIK